MLVHWFNQRARFKLDSDRGPSTSLPHAVHFLLGKTGMVRELVYVRQAVTADPYHGREVTRRVPLMESVQQPYLESLEQELRGEWKGLELNAVVCGKEMMGGLGTNVN